MLSATCDAGASDGTGLEEACADDDASPTDDLFDSGGDFGPPLAAPSSSQPPSDCVSEAAGASESPSSPSAAAPPVVGVYLGEAGRRIYLSELFRRLRERVYYPPRQSAWELREIITQQLYHLARVIDGREGDYIPFVPEK
jgi:hypothetical protein